MAESGVAGKVVMITGAASGIGRAIAVAFAADGADVIGVDINGSALAPLEAQGVLPVTADVTEEAAVRDAAAQALDRFGRIDVLFNNAGLGGRRPITEIGEGEFERMIAVHLFGAFYGLRAVLPVMRAQGSGRVINTLSRGAEAQASGWAAYGAAKAGMLSLTRVAAAECAGTDILVNGMIPGPTRSGMMTGPNLQAPEAVVPSARWLATLPAGGPTGKVFWNMKEYSLFAPREA
jgi:NAD(P)-dependent dehydrogenase (short-subunit alcohol dehydrogenase family)